MTKISILGLGAMGSRMAANLLKAGHAVTVWNRTHAAAVDLVVAGAKKAATPREAVDGADFVIATVRDDEASREEPHLRPSLQTHSRRDPCRPMSVLFRPRS
jgi:3-hydroxyisobutyrate dehydrogenase